MSSWLQTQFKSFGKYFAMRNMF